MSSTEKFGLRNRNKKSQKNDSDNALSDGKSHLKIPEFEELDKKGKPVVKPKESIMIMIYKSTIIYYIFNTLAHLIFGYIGIFCNPFALSCYFLAYKDKIDLEQKVDYARLFIISLLYHLIQFVMFLVLLSKYNAASIKKNFRGYMDYFKTYLESQVIYVGYHFVIRWLVTDLNENNIIILFLPLNGIAFFCMSIPSWTFSDIRLQFDDSQYRRFSVLIFIGYTTLVWLYAGMYFKFDIIGYYS